jgi:hypothetical protein
VARIADHTDDTGAMTGAVHELVASMRTALDENA